MGDTSQPSAAALPVDRLQRIGIVVPDLEKAVRNYSTVFGVDSWDIRERRAGDVRATFRGREVDGVTYRTATGTTPGGVVTWELVEPGPGESSYTVFRCTRRAGVHDLSLTVTDEAGLEEVRSLFAARDVDELQRHDIDGAGSVVTFDTTDHLGGFNVKVLVGDADSADAILGDPTDVWTGTADVDRPDCGPLEVTQLHHFGIVVEDSPSAVDRYADLFGVGTWNFMNWRTEKGRLDAPFYRGEPVDHGYFCGMGFDYRDFGWEIIQPTWGPSHYKNDFLDLVGEGVHHLQLLYPEDQDHWDQITDWMGGLGAPVVMGSTLRGGATTFYYLDTRELLGGWTMEATLRHAGADPALRVYDFVRQYD